MADIIGLAMPAIASLFSEVNSAITVIWQQSDLFESARGQIWTADDDSGRNRREHIELRNVSEAARFLEEPAQHVDGQSHMKILDIPATREVFQQRRKLFQSRLGLDRPGMWSHNHTSSTGSLLVSKSGNGLLFETPWAVTPFLHAYMARIPQPDHAQTKPIWHVVLVHDSEQFKMDQFWDVSCRIALVTSTRNETPFDPSLVLSSWLATQYLESVEKKAKDISKLIDEGDTYLEGMEESDRTGPTNVDEGTSTTVNANNENSPSELNRIINRANNALRTSALDQHIAFGTEAVHWAEEIVATAGYVDSDRTLQDRRSKCEQLHPDRLKERIADIRNRIADLNAQRRQEREDKYQAQAAARQIAEDARIKEERNAEKERQNQKDDQKKTEKALQDLRDEIMLQSLHDARTMRGIAWVTVSFLPATFVSSFFGMNFFNGVSGPVPFDAASRNVWVFFVIALPISLVVLAVFWRWDEQGRREEEQKLNERRARLGIDPVENERKTSRTNRVLSKVLGLEVEKKAEITPEPATPSGIPAGA